MTGLDQLNDDFIDLLVRPCQENAEKVLRALVAFGAPLDAAGVAELDFRWEGVVYQIGVPP